MAKGTRGHYEVDGGFEQVSEGPRWSEEELERKNRITSLIEKEHGYPRELIEEQGREELLRAGVDLSRLTLECTQGVLTVTGEVSDRAQKRLVSVTLEEVDGVESVINLTEPLDPSWD